MIRVESLTKKYGKMVANDRVNLDVKSGQVAILLGPNGAGKSTLIKSICGLLRVSGMISIGGYENTSPEAKRLLGYVPEFPVLYPMLTVYEHLEFIARAYKLTDWERDAEALLQSFELGDKRNKLGKELSKGMQQKVNICCALLPKPKAVIFDEPLVGLDPHGIRELKHMISKLREEGCALLISTHMIDSVDHEWDLAYIMQNGRLVKTCKHSELQDDETLESIYFSITEGNLNE